VEAVIRDMIGEHPVEPGDFTPDAAPLIGEVAQILVGD
jgi:hypothetical protein